MRPIDADELEEIVQSGLRENPHKDGFARVCHRTEYMHFLDVIRRMPTIAPPPNDPLTLEELCEMDGEPVYIHWLVNHKKLYDCWAIVNCKWQGVQTPNYGAAFFDRYGEFWVSYRRDPEDTIHV